MVTILNILVPYGNHRIKTEQVTFTRYKIISNVSSLFKLEVLILLIRKMYHENS